MRSLIIVLLTCGPVLLNFGAGCLHSPACYLPVVFPGVQVQVVNAQTGETVNDAVVALTEGEYTETLFGGHMGYYSGAYGRAGTYSLTVEAPGFARQQIDGIVVESIPYECRVATASLTIRLTPSA